MDLLLYLLVHLEVGHGVNVGNPVLVGHIDALAARDQLMRHNPTQQILPTVSAKSSTGIESGICTYIGVILT
jgi:hypothetical protein